MCLVVAGRYPHIAPLALNDMSSTTYNHNVPRCRAATLAQRLHVGVDANSHPGHGFQGSFACSCRPGPVDRHWVCRFEPSCWDAVENLQPIDAAHAFCAVLLAGQNIALAKHLDPTHTTTAQHNLYVRQGLERPVSWRLVRLDIIYTECI